MNLEKIILSLNFKSVKEGPNKYNLNIDSFYPNKTKLHISIIKQDGKYYFTDNKETLKFMNKMYELKANDVKMCINDVLKHYHFIVTKGELLAEIKPSENAMDTLIHFFMAIGQLINMYVFFDTP